MRNFILFILIFGVIGAIFALPLTITSFTNKSFYPNDDQHVINNKYEGPNSADFAKIKSTNLEKYSGPVEHLFTHCLIAYPELANSSHLAKDYKRDCITSKEFENLLNELYNNDFALVDINSVYEIKDGKAIKKDLFLPKGKKPLILSFDDVVYDQRKQKTGMVDKLAINSSGKIVSETLENWNGGSGKVVLSNKHEFVSILDDFALSHPDFSVNGAKGTICLTGFDGILGYRTSSKNKQNRNEEIEKAKAVVNKLKETGWNFACHSFGHYHMKKISDEKFAEEISLWKKEVEPIIGKTSVYVYPYGEWEISDENLNYTNKHQMLIDNGFKIFCGVGIKNFFGHLPFAKTTNKALFMDRVPIDGYTLNNKKEELKRLFDANKVIYS